LIIFVAAICGKSKFCFLLEQLGLKFLRKNRCSDSLSGLGWNTQTFYSEGGNLPLSYM